MNTGKPRMNTEEFNKAKNKFPSVKMRKNPCNRWYVAKKFKMKNTGSTGFPPNNFTAAKGLTLPGRSIPDALVYLFGLMRFFNLVNVSGQ